MGRFATLVLAVAYAAPTAAQMVPSADARGDADTTAAKPDTIGQDAQVDAIAGKYDPDVKVDDFTGSKIVRVDIATNMSRHHKTPAEHGDQGGGTDHRLPRAHQLGVTEPVSAQSGV